MPRVVPSQVRQFLETALPEAIARANEAGPLFALAPEYAPILETMAQMVDMIPQDLQPTDPLQFENMVFGLAAIRHQVANWRAGNEKRALGVVPGKDRHPVVLIYNALRTCNDQALAEDAIGLDFIPDRALAASIRLDERAATNALGNGEWKAATVLAGAALEALLLWSIQTRSDEQLAPVRQQLLGQRLISKLDSSLETWNLSALIDAAHRLGLIGDAAQRAATNAREFRNLIHPGRNQRLKQPCDRGTSFLAIGAVELVTMDLSKPRG